MQAIVVNEFGGPEVLEPTEMPDPEASAGEVVIEVELAGITFVETQLRAGRAPRPEMLPTLPWIPGNGVGGVVGELGPGVGADLAGARVISTTGGSGGYATRVAVPAEDLIAVPDGLTMAAATALLADGRTAIALARAARPRPGETALVLAAAGGVGSLLVQLVRAAGATVAAAAGSERKLELARELGAAIAVDYTGEGWSAGLDPVDVVFDGVGGDAGLAAFELLRDGGRFSGFGLASGSFTKIAPEEVERRGLTVLRGTGLAPGEMRELTEAALAAASAGRLRAVVGQVIELSRAAAAHTAIEARETLGKSLLRPAGGAGSRI
jgi:NADPH2:quinone reductase